MFRSYHIGMNKLLRKILFTDMAISWHARMSHIGSLRTKNSTLRQKKKSGT